MRQDLFFDKQPPLLFIDDLKSEYHAEKPHPFGKRQKTDKECEFFGVHFDKAFPDNEGLLDTVYEDLEKFFSICEINGNQFPIKTVYRETSVFEEYYIDVNENEIVVSAGDTEGIRRGLIWIEDEMQRREGPYLPVGSIKKTPHIDKRITRCFFSPINRPPKNQDELSDDIDYYPEQYLNRLMHDGANGIWIYSRFSDLIKSSYFEEYGEGREKRIKKLNSVIAKCKRYGIGVYLFAIEPLFTSKEQAEKYPKLAGGVVPGTGGFKTFCLNTEEGKACCREAGRQIFELAPGLAGYIGITSGERITSCGSTTSACPNCEGLSQGERLAIAVDELTKGMREVKPDATFISWTYGHSRWKHEEIKKYVRKMPDSVVAMQNFEDVGLDMQLGKERLAMDYWLSYVGPSELFKITAETGKEAGKKVYAKMQVCCSHELASVPYIPAPGNVYDKYSAAHELGISGMLQCWYFGNYPCLMSKAAGELAFEDFNIGKDDFIRRLAGITWGQSNADKMVEAYKLFEKAYRDYPTSIMYSYYGPMHDSVVWELQLLPKNQQLPRSWQTTDPTDGDRIGECILSSHTTEEILTLLTEMVDLWAKGRKIVEALPVVTEVQRKELSVIKALELLFKGALDIIEFYRLRDLLGKNIDASTQLEKMREIVLRGIEQSAEMITLWNNDTRLGYHSEGEGYKFFPEKLEHRIAQLKNLLETEFIEVEQRIKDGKYPLEYYLGIDGVSAKSCNMLKGNLQDAEWTYLDDERAKFRMSYDDKKMYFELVSPYESEFYVTPEFKMSTPGVTMLLRANQEARIYPVYYVYQGLHGERIDEELSKWVCTTIRDDNNKTHLVLTLDIEKIDWDRKLPFKLSVRTRNDDEGFFEVPWNKINDRSAVLFRFYRSTEELGWVFPTE